MSIIKMINKMMGHESEAEKLYKILNPDSTRTPSPSRPTSRPRCCTCWATTSLIWPSATTSSAAMWTTRGPSATMAVSTSLLRATWCSSSMVRRPPPSIVSRLTRCWKKTWSADYPNNKAWSNSSKPSSSNTCPAWTTTASSPISDARCARSLEFRV